MIFDNNIRDLKYFIEPRFQGWVSEEFKFMKKYVFDDTDVLDIGSETGRTGFMLLDVLGFKLKNLYLTDYTEQLVKNVNSHIKESRSEIKVDLQDVTSLSYEASTFKTVLCLGGVLNLLYSENYGGKPDSNNKSEDENFTLAFLECVRVLQQKGFFIFEIEKNYFQKINNILNKHKNLKIVELNHIAASKDRPYIIACIEKLGD